MVGTDEGNVVGWTVVTVLVGEVVGMMKTGIGGRVGKTVTGTDEGNGNAVGRRLGSALLDGLSVGVSVDGAVVNG